MKQYQAHRDGRSWTDLERKASFGLDPGNADYREMLLLVAAGEAEILPAAPAPVLVRPLRKLAIVDRMTDAELDAADAFFATPEGKRPRERWIAATEVDTTNQQTRAMFVALYGEARTDELLAAE